MTYRTTKKHLENKKERVTGKGLEDWRRNMVQGIKTPTRRKARSTVSL
jgi:hypothetical protein